MKSITNAPEIKPDMRSFRSNKCQMERMDCNTSSKNPRTANTSNPNVNCWRGVHKNPWILSPIDKNEHILKAQDIT